MSYTPLSIKYSTANSTPVTLNVAEPAYSYASNTFFIGTENSDGYLAIGGQFYVSQQAQIFTKANAAFTKANSAGANISVSNYNTAGDISNVVSNVTTLRFDTDTGISVSDLGSGAVKIALGSSFKTWKVNGQSGLVASGEDTVNFLTANGISIVADQNSSPKSFQIGLPTVNGGSF